MVYVMEQKQFLFNLKKKNFILEWKTTLTKYQGTGKIDFYVICNC